MIEDSWTHLKSFTAARIALGRTGGSVPTKERLDFQLSHARARDAVLAPFHPEDLEAKLKHLPLPSVIVESRAPDRSVYLRRPDLGRRLSDHSLQILESLSLQTPTGSFDLVIMISDGLSTTAALRQSPVLLEALLPLFLKSGWRIAPLVIIRHARVAIQDQVGALLNATISLILLGERPGLGSPDSLGAYFTFRPVLGKTDADRNCVSNIRPEGLAPAAAADKLFHLIARARELQLSGVGLKDLSGQLDDFESNPALD
jgi:ethanolamine ammonia-lyase small subunit